MAVLCLGLALGSETDVMAVFVAQAVPRKLFARVFGIGSLGYALGVAAGPYALTRVQHLTHTPAGPILTAAGALLVAAGVFLSVPRSTARRRPDAEAAPAVEARGRLAPGQA